MTLASAFKSVVLDVDSTLCGIEGIDWLAARRGEDVAERVALETEMAMRGELPLESVYGRRISVVRPSRREIELLGDAYIESLAHAADKVIPALIGDGIVVALLSGGIRQAILPVAMKLGISDDDVHAVDLRFTPDGDYAGFDESSPLTTAMGKRVVLESMRPARPVLSVGDGSTDLAARAAADAFAAYAGFVARGPVMRAADVVVESFEEIDSIVRNGFQR